MKKTISLAMAAALAVSGAVTTVPVFADDVTNITILESNRQRIN